MSEERAFLEAIRDNPDDCVDRLVFSDWLEEHDHPRGKLLRLQTELVLGVDERERRNELHRQEKRLLRQNRDNWMTIPRPVCSEYSFDRGFCNVTLNTKRMLGQSARDVEDWIFRSWVHWVRLERPNRYLATLMQQPWLVHLTALDLSRSGLTDEIVYRLTTTPGALPRLRELDLGNNRLTDGGIQHLARSPLLSQLRSLDIRNNRITDVGVNALLESPHASNLRWLDIHGTNLSPETMANYLRWLKARPPAGSPYSVLVNSIGMQLSYIPAGTFLMGSPHTEKHRRTHEGPRQAVRITRPFYLGRYHVTQQQFERIMGHNPSSFATSGGHSSTILGLSSHHFPVDMVSPEDAELFCKRLSARPEEKQAGREYRLATEAEWEHACRACTPEDWVFAFGNTLGAHQAQFDHSEPYGRARRGERQHRPEAVGSYRPNPWGLYDMHGNAWDWVGDCYEEYSKQEGVLEDRVGPDTGTHGILRGGSWYNAAHYCRSSSRFRTTRTEGSFCIGFRVALSC